ncbi:hypothetical protein C900_00701 [Fulvivirga imtechensis AK7]|uniref:Uncharacterized protein n=1 Tax=Fulvivirga imtechensis AK7 TaxID=1237149 RepID=L8JIU8_9BACT|nr:hypothetical protein [Fulvivirga imtechensis]ELR68173.1 hypothetical protein C900_00701 [Fulvivirga imtechensis AK7]
MKILNDTNKVDDVYLSPYDRWLNYAGANHSTEVVGNKKTLKKDGDVKT